MGAGGKSEADVGGVGGRRRPPGLELSLRATERTPATAEINATMARLGLGVEWSDEAVRQLLDAAAAAEDYLRAFPDQAETLARDPEVALRSMVDKGFLSTPVDALQDALAATGKQVKKLERPARPIRLTGVRFEDSPTSSRPMQPES